MILEERERDIELAARIGQTLLTKNRALTNRVDTLEINLTELKLINSRFTEESHQLKHQINLKDELLRGFEEEQLRNQIVCQTQMQDLEDRNMKIENENSILKRRTEELSKNFSSYKREIDIETECDNERLHSELSRRLDEIFQKNIGMRALEEENNLQFNRILELERNSRKRELCLIDARKQVEGSHLSMEILKDEIENLEERMIDIRQENDEIRTELKNSEDEANFQMNHENLANEMAGLNTPKNQVLSSTRYDECDSGVVDEACFYSEILTEIATPVREERIEEESFDMKKLPQPDIFSPKAPLSANAKKVKKGILQKIKISKKGKVPLDYHSPGAILVQDLLNSTRHDFDIINTPLKLEESDCLPDSSSSSFSRFFKRSFSFKSKPTISRSMSTTELWRKHPSAFRF